MGDPGCVSFSLTSYYRGNYVPTWTPSTPIPDVYPISDWPRPLSAVMLCVRHWKTTILQIPRIHNMIGVSLQVKFSRGKLVSRSDPQVKATRGEIIKKGNIARMGNLDILSVVMG